MRRLSMMGSSKYEFNPEQFNEDVKKHRENYRRKEEKITKILEEFINQDTYQDRNFRIITKVLKMLKIRYDL
ncbi:hypothetical protein [Clostridium botulinum]|uniref:Conserved domain protein n=2 Tax=Clostridium botulinum TaxID=1491 RepID=C1FRA5_CLOBJ|nr:hypothetical protein [Clostridium botulinum]ACO86123.1 conserved domain protein [Clostridium botulinum A2 str. Kyoto]AUN08884.1 hypothetical protein RSJ14_12290 [Clostridium botulinum]AUN19631.1 hypothetical protein B2M06_11720 [Clostridium botulinum]MBN3364295.1 hypothetical protein [Clostridium botulinum]MBN3368469.1 hypothetical protein [Clostridium botulinum]